MIWSISSVQRCQRNIWASLVKDEGGACSGMKQASRMCVHTQHAQHNSGRGEGGLNAAVHTIQHHTVRIIARYYLSRIRTSD